MCTWTSTGGRGGRFLSRGTCPPCHITYGKFMVHSQYSCRQYRATNSTLQLYCSINSWFWFDQLFWNIFVHCPIGYIYSLHSRYCILTPETYPRWNGTVIEGIKHLMQAVNMEPDQWQLGKTKVFIKSPESVSWRQLFKGNLFIESNQNSVKWGHLNKQDTFNHPKCNVCVQFNPWNQDTSLIRKLSSVPRVSGLERFHCTHVHVYMHII